MEDKTRYMELKEFTGRKHIFPELQGRTTRRPVFPTAAKVIDNHWFSGSRGRTTAIQSKYYRKPTGNTPTGSVIAAPQLPPRMAPAPE